MILHLSVIAQHLSLIVGALYERPLFVRFNKTLAVIDRPYSLQLFRRTDLPELREKQHVVDNLHSASNR